VKVHPRHDKETEVESPSGVGVVDLREDPSVVSVGDKLVWQGRPVQVIDAARLGPDWEQVVIRFLDRPTQPAASMPYENLVAGLSR
jgi:hypothetical protein